MTMAQMMQVDQDVLIYHAVSIIKKIKCSAGKAQELAYQGIQLYIKSGNFKSIEEAINHIIGW